MAQINKPNTHFNTKLWTGTGASNSITGVNFKPDLVWVKRRNTAGGNMFTDIIRGVTKTIISNETSAEQTFAQGLTSFNADGFTVGSEAGFNNNGDTFVGWNWLAGGTAVSNTQGSITSQVSANQTAGFSIVSYTGTGANATVGHGLGSAPKMVIFKNRDNGTQEWDTYHIGLTNATYFIQLNSTNVQSNTNGALRFNSTAPSTNYFSVGTSTTTNESGSAMIAYCFAEKKGFSKFGSYTGNGSTDGTFVYTGFKPAWVMFKRTDDISEWIIFDNKRNTFNLTNLSLEPNTSDAEAAVLAREIDIYSNGFKSRGTSAYINASGGTYIYMTFAENPLVGTNNIPATAR